MPLEGFSLMLKQSSQLTETFKNKNKKNRALGGSEGNATVNLEFPLAFMTAMADVLESEHRAAEVQIGKTMRQKFRFIYLSGAFVERDQNKKLFLERDPPNKDFCVFPAARKLKVGETITDTSGPRPNISLPPWSSFVGLLGIKRFSFRRPS